MTRGYRFYFLAAMARLAPAYIAFGELGAGAIGAGALATPS
jgi:hypothetical protein